MSHPQQLNFVRSVKEKFESYFSNVKVLEVGSLNINGSIRQFFNNCDYTGVDLGVGKDVDVVAFGENLDYPNETFDTTCSCECFEHNEKWKETFINMHRMTKVDGLIFFSCATEGRHEHGTKRTSPADAPFCNDYYCNLKQSDFEVLPLNDMFSKFEFNEAHPPHDLYFYGLKR